MPEDAETVRVFRDRVRLLVIERLAVTNALSTLMLHAELSTTESRDLLRIWLDTEGVRAKKASDLRFKGNPSTAALYADEAQSVIEDIKRLVDRLAADLDWIEAFTTTPESRKHIQ